MHIDIALFTVQKKNFLIGDVLSKKIDTTDKSVENAVLLRILKFAYTSNNTTYAVVGDLIGYWHFFPSPQGKEWGIIPAWGMAEVVYSGVEDIAVGTKYYGFYPMATHLLIQPGQISKRSFIDESSHRRSLPDIYNLYVSTESDPIYQQNIEDEMLIFRPLFTTSFLIHSMFRGNGFYNAQQVIVTSASSKTAISLAHCMLSNDVDDKIRLIALTSIKNKAFVEGLKLYNEVLTYDQIDLLKRRPSCIVDFAGNHDLQADLQNHLGEQLRYNCLVGIVHWNEQEGSKQQKQKGTFFFAPSYAKEVIESIGIDTFTTNLNVAFKDFIQYSKKWLHLQKHRGGSALIEVHKRITMGDINPNEGHIIQL